MRFAELTLCFFIFTASVTMAQDREKLPCVDKEFSIVAHIFRDTLGQLNITEAQIIDRIAEANVHFAPICISFKVCEFRYHDNFQYDNNVRGEEWEEMQTLYHVRNRINIYYVADIEVPQFACGYAGLGDIATLDKSGIVIQKLVGCCDAGSKTHPHELGHYFGLEHTFETNNGQELVDGSNCTTAGDGICDTPADPYIIGSSMSIWLDNCRFIYEGQDANGEYYDPNVGNIMSYYPNDCGCSFTHEQLHYMANYYLQNQGMW